MREKKTVDRLTAIISLWDLGGGVTGKPEELENDEFSQWNTKRVTDIIPETLVVEFCHINEQLLILLSPRMASMTLRVFSDQVLKMVSTQTKEIERLGIR